MSATVCVQREGGREEERERGGEGGREGGREGERGGGREGGRERGMKGVFLHHFLPSSYQGEQADEEVGVSAQLIVRKTAQVTELLES